jgi:hypothetical protein
MTQKKGTPPARGGKKEQNKINSIHNNLFAGVPPAYRGSLNALWTRYGLRLIPLNTVFFVFRGYRFSDKRISQALKELDKAGVIEITSMVGIKFLRERK